MPQRNWQYLIKNKLTQSIRVVIIILLTPNQSLEIHTLCMFSTIAEEVVAVVEASAVADLQPPQPRPELDLERHQPVAS